MEIIVSHILQAKERSQSVVLFEKSHSGLGRELVLMFFFSCMLLESSTSQNLATGVVESIYILPFYIVCCAFNVEYPYAGYALRTTSKQCFTL